MGRPRTRLSQQLPELTRETSISSRQRSRGPGLRQARRRWQQARPLQRRVVWDVAPRRSRVVVAGAAGSFRQTARLRWPPRPSRHADGFSVSWAFTPACPRGLGSRSRVCVCVPRGSVNNQISRSTLLQALPRRLLEIAIASGACMVDRACGTTGSRAQGQVPPR